MAVESTSVKPFEIEQSEAKTTEAVAEAKAEANAPEAELSTPSQGKIQALRTSVVESATAVKTLASEGYQQVQEKGVRACTAEAVAAASTLAKDMAAQAQEKAQVVYKDTVTGTVSLVERTQETARATAELATERARSSVNQAAEQSALLQQKTLETVKDGKFQATAAGAAGGAVTLGTGGAITGLAAGTICGAAVGLVPALFTFGLSIPIGAVVGGSTGLVVGSTVGGTAGALGGGAAGRRIHDNRDEISEVAKNTMAKVSSNADLLKTQSMAGVAYVTEKASEIGRAPARAVGLVK